MFSHVSTMHRNSIIYCISAGTNSSKQQYYKTTNYNQLLMTRNCLCTQQAILATGFSRIVVAFAPAKISPFHTTVQRSSSTLGWSAHQILLVELRGSQTFLGCKQCNNTVNQHKLHKTTKLQIYKLQSALISQKHKQHKQHKQYNKIITIKTSITNRIISASTNNTNNTM